MATSKKQMTAAQFLYKLYFDEQIRIPIHNVNPGSRVFLYKDYNPTDEPKHKLEPISTVPYNVTEVWLEYMRNIARHRNSPLEPIF